jgi:hypothetical protein
VQKMGDRAMAQINMDDGALYVYTHWGGNNLPEDARKAIQAARARIGCHDSYADRIIVDQLTKEGRDEETGFGLMLTPAGEDEYNNDKPSVVIDLNKQLLTVTRENETGQPKTQVTPFADIFKGV